MKPKVLTLLSIIFILAIAFFQGYIVYNMYILQKKSLTEELDVVLNNSYKKYLTLRLKQINNTDEPVILFQKPEMFNSQDTIISHYNLDTFEINTKSIYSDNLVDLFNITISQYAISDRPLDLSELNSLVRPELQKRNITSSFFLRLIDQNGSYPEQSQQPNRNKPDFSVHSQKIALDLDQTKFLELNLIHSQGTIFARLITVIVLCSLFSFFCIYVIGTLQTTLSKQRKLAASKNDFFGQISHELKRPLTQLHIAIHALVEKVEHKDKNFQPDKYWDIALRATGDISSKIDMILALAREEDGVLHLNIKEFDLPATLYPMVEHIEMTAVKPTKIEVINQLKSPFIRADADHFMQCIANLIENAIKYSGSSVGILIRLYSENNTIVLAVKDNGIGIAEKNLPRIFQKYDRLDTANSTATGFGIGLNYVQKMIEKHGGTVELTSQLGVGSEFFISLPC